MMRPQILLVLSACLLAGPSFAGSYAPAAKPTPSEWSRCEGGTGISVDAQIASCTAVLKSGKQSRTRVAEALRIRCLLYSEKDESSAAIADCSRAVALDPKNSESYFTRGKAYRNAKDFDRAIADFDEALLMKPGSPGVLTLRGLTYYQKGDYDRAIADYTETLKRWPELRLAQGLLAQAKAAKAKRAGTPRR